MDPHPGRGGRSGVRGDGVPAVGGEVLGFLDRYPSTQLLAQRLDRAGADLSVFANALRRDDRPLFTPIDRWGHTPPFAPPTTLSAQSVAALARAHLTGQAPVHRRLPLRLDTVERRRIHRSRSSMSNSTPGTTTAASSPAEMPTRSSRT